MRRRIPENDWQQFFERLNDACRGWRTSIHSAGGKRLNSVGKLSLAAFIFMRKNGQTLIELIAGDSLENHCTYTIFDPQKIVLMESENISILIKDNRAVKTSISLAQPEIEVPSSW